jgi:aspartate aminotransferase-like enzyme
MTAHSALTFGVAESPDDFAQVRRLNYRTFVEEIPQHPSNADGVLVDKFETECVFIVAREGPRLVGMLSVRDRRPFSLDGKLPDVDRYLPAGRRPCEVRLLAVDPGHRSGMVLRGLLDRLVVECDARGFDLAVISSTVRQLRLYSHMGCVPFGPRVGTPDAEYQPMYVTREALLARAGGALGRARTRTREPDNFLTGPVHLAPTVRRRLGAALQSHRGEAFARDLDAIRSGIAALTGTPHVAVLAGSGTLANDMVGAQLARSGRPGVVVANGEFGERLLDHARRHGLLHTPLVLPWGTPLDDLTLEASMRATPGVGWLWAVHCETSTGMLNDIELLHRAAARHGADLALDAASSVGTLPVDLSSVAFASTVSGKALGGAPGLALVCSVERVPPAQGRIPRYLDLGLYLCGDGIPFTQPSPLVGALAEAVVSTDWRARFGAVRDASRCLRERLGAAGVRLVTPECHASPAVFTLVVPTGRDAPALARRIEREGFLIGWRSYYLRERRWIQLALMGDFPASRLDALADAVERAWS